MMGLFDVIKYEGDNTTFIWKHPREDFNSLSQLIVHENQEAVFFMNGQALDVFGPGRYTLKTQNIPIIGKLLNLATGGLNPFHCEIYFINKSEQMAIKWGTDTRIQFVEPIYKFPLSIGASGEMSMQVVDSKKLLVKLVGTEENLSQQNLITYFRAFLMTRAKTYIAQTIKTENINIFEIDEKLSQFSDEIKELLLTDFNDYGIALRTFLISRVIKPDGEEEYEKFKELHFRQYADIAEAKIRQQAEIINAETEAQKKVIDSKAEATKRSQEGYTYQQERGFDVAEKVADNESVGKFTNIGLGLGTMMGVGGAIGNMIGNLMNKNVNSKVQDVQNSNTNIENTNNKEEQNNTNKTTAQMQKEKFCDNCGTKISNNAKFCEECGNEIKKEKETCSNCGYKFERDSKFCPECGKKKE